MEEKKQKRRSQRLSLADALVIGNIKRDEPMNKSLEKQSDQVDQDLQYTDKDEAFIAVLEAEKLEWEQLDTLSPPLTAGSLPPPRGDLVESSVNLLRDVNKRMERFQRAQIVANVKAKNLQMQKENLEMLLNAQQI